MAVTKCNDKADRVSWLYLAGRGACALVGAAYATLAAFPTAVLASILFGFASPSAIWESGFRGLINAVWTSLEDPLILVVPVLAAFGGIAGWMAHARYEAQRYRKLHLEILTYAVAIDLTVACLLCALIKLVLAIVFGSRPE